ncbi:hypothetical protein ACEPAI_8034 [Sanghuangporus weigelae]
MPDFNPLFAPLLLPLPLPVINEDNENNLDLFVGAAQALLQWAPWPEVHFGVQVTDGAAINHGLLAPPLTPLPQFLEEIQEEPNEPAPDFIPLNNVQDNQFIQDISNISGGPNEVPNDEFIYGPLEPIIDADDAQEPGPVGFDVNLLFAEFHTIFDDGGQENDNFAYEEDAHAGLIVDGLFFETLEDEDDGDIGDDMELDEVDSLL